LNLFDIATQKFTHFEYNESDTNSVSSNNLFSLLKDSHNNLWIGTSGEGINRLDLSDKKITRFPEEKKIRYATVTAIIEDNNGVMWFSTKQGIFSYDYNKDEFTSFPELTGEFHINAAIKDEDGLIYFGGLNGVLRFDPSIIKPSVKQPAVKLTSFKLFNKEIIAGENQILKKSIDFEDKITLSHNQDVVTFEFAALQFPFSSDCEYAIKLENFDENWRNIGKDRTATYTNLAPGNYTFKVKSRAAGSDWGDNYASVDLLILKPFWLQWWAFVIYFLLIIGAFYIFRKYIIAWEHMKANLRLERLTHEKDIELYNLKQQFFTNISHEIRTPITLILSAINRLGEKYGREDKSNIYLATVKKHGNHLLNLVNELLDIKNLETKIRLKISKGDFVNFCEEIYLSFSESAAKKNINFSFTASTPELEIWFDKNQMEKVLYNLLSNAFKFTQTGGSISVFITENEENAILKVEDSGIGIAKRQLTKIFNRFYQTSGAGKIKESGFGLGLSISKEVIDLHQGSINAISERSVGSTFTVIIPKGKAHFKQEELKENQLISDQDELYFLPEKLNPTSIDEKKQDVLKDQTLLIVEDNADIRHYLVEIFTPYCDILQAGNGKEAFEKAIENLPDLVISDIMMPVMDGIELTQNLKTDMRTSHIPVILLTARATFQHKMEGFDTGADDYVTKPFHEKLLLSRVINLIKNRSFLREKFSGQTLLTISDGDFNTTDQKFLTNLIKAIEENVDDESLNAEFLSKELGMSHSVIYKKIKSLTGMTFVEFVRDYKLKIARSLIEQQGFSVSEASFKVGYSDRKYFSKLFKQKFGENPSHFLIKK
ncbi:MAG: ATP-binding protein, partial [Leeuwenhoekiella sp.]